MRRAKVFTSGNSQAVRLPKDFQFHSREVAIEKRGNKIIDHGCSGEHFQFPILRHPILKGVWVRVVAAEK